MVFVLLLMVFFNGGFVALKLNPCDKVPYGSANEKEEEAKDSFSDGGRIDV